MYTIKIEDFLLNFIIFSILFLVIYGLTDIIIPIEKIECIEYNKTNEKCITYEIQYKNKIYREVK